VIEGTLKYQIDDAPVTLQAGEVLFIPAAAVHSVKTVGRRTARDHPRGSLHPRDRGVGGVVLIFTLGAAVYRLIKGLV